MLEWQMRFAGKALPGGIELDIVEAATDPNGFHLRLSKADADSTCDFYVHSSVSVGGKTYLLLQTSAAQDAQLITVRLLDRNRILTMDPDRFSSLFNAFNLCLSSGAFVKGTDLVEALGDYTK